MKTFAAIDIGSYELAMKIFEISKSGMKQIDYLRHRIDLGTDTYTNGKISTKHLEELCQVLIDYRKIMLTYEVSDYKAYGTSAIRETQNTIIVLDHIHQRTGIKVEVLSNSEQRFLDYKSIASQGEQFDRIIEKPTAIMDIGGGSIQLSLFDKDALVATQNLRLGILRLRETVERTGCRPGQIEKVLQELIQNQMNSFKKLFVQDKTVENVIVVDDYMSSIIQKNNPLANDKGCMTEAEYMLFLKNMRYKTAQEIAKDLLIPEENTPLFFISAILIKCCLEVLGAKLLWSPGVSLCDGMAYEYAENNKLYSFSHNFDRDILACASNVNKRYGGSRKRAEKVTQTALLIYDAVRKQHGLGKRERLFLQIASALYESGKFISLLLVGECSYQIVMATEIIGLSHAEREIVANVVKYTHADFEYYDIISKESSLSREEYLTIVKLTAVLRVADGLERSQESKYKSLKAVVKDEELVLTVQTDENLLLERGTFEGKVAFFKEVYNITPVIHHKV